MKRSDTLPPLWTCPKCGAKFVTANMSHSCGRFRVKDLFANSEPQVVQLYERYKRMVKACGAVTIVPQKTRLVFMVRMRFAGVYARKSYLRAAFLLNRRLPPDPRIAKETAYTPRCGAQKDFVRRGNAARRRSG